MQIRNAAEEYAKLEGSSDLAILDFENKRKILQQINQKGELKTILLKCFPSYKKEAYLSYFSLQSSDFRLSKPTEYLRAMAQKVGCSAFVLYFEIDFFVTVAYHIARAHFKAGLADKVWQDARYGTLNDRVTEEDLKRVNEILRQQLRFTIQSQVVEKKGDSFKISKVVEQIPISSINLESDFVSRSNFDQEALNDLARSVEEEMLDLPTVRKKDGGYEVVIGSRRILAAKLAGKKFVDAIISQDDDKESLRKSLLSNIHSETLSPIDLKDSLMRLKDLFGYEHKQLAELIKKPRSYVTEILGLDRLPEEVQKVVHLRKILTTSAIEISKIPDKTLQENIAKRIVAGEPVSSIQIKDIARACKGKPFKKRTIQYLEREFLTFCRSIDADGLSLEDAEWLFRRINGTAEKLKEIATPLASRIEELKKGSGS